MKNITTSKGGGFLSLIKKIVNYRLSTIYKKKHTAFMKNHPKWNFEEFTTFLLLYASNADLELSINEEEEMKKRLDLDKYEKIKQEFDASSDYKIIQIILSYKGIYFPTLDRTKELLNLIKKQFFADGDFSTLEKNTYRILQKLL